MRENKVSHVSSTHSLEQKKMSFSLSRELHAGTAGLYRLWDVNLISTGEISPLRCTHIAATLTLIWRWGRDLGLWRCAGALELETRSHHTCLVFLRAYVISRTHINM